MPTPRSVFLLAALAVASRLHAQQPGGARVEGVITDSIHAHPLAGATVLLSPTSGSSAATLSAVSDDRGRYTFGDLAAGSYLLVMETPLLDSLELILPPRTIELAGGQRLRLPLAIPSGATLRTLACRGVELAPGQGAVVGRLTSAERDAPIADRAVTVSWNELTVDRATLAPSSEERTGAVKTDARGEFRLCGVPTETFVTLAVARDSGAGVSIELSVPEDAGVVRQNISLAVAGRGWGTASLAGTIAGLGARPVAMAEVRVVGADASARSDSAGHYHLEALPAGTQVMEVRKVGYLLGRYPVELRRGERLARDVQLTRIVSLDSVRIVSQRERYREFESRRRRSSFGKFLTEEDIARPGISTTSDVFRTMPGFRVVHTDEGDRVISSRGGNFSRMAERACPVNVVLDGVQHQEIDLIDPHDIGAMEVYPGPAGAPAQFPSPCGAIIIWSKRRS